MATARISVDIDTVLLAQLRHAANDQLDDWIAAACRSRLTADATRAVDHRDNAHRNDPASTALSDAVRAVEDEAEHQIHEAATKYAQQRTGKEPADEDYAVALRAVRDRLDQACRDLDHPDTDTD